MTDVSEFRLFVVSYFESIDLGPDSLETFFGVVGKYCLLRTVTSESIDSEPDSLDTFVNGLK